MALFFLTQVIDADWFEHALKDKQMRIFIPDRRSRYKPVGYNKR